jgi:hypothetical protein
VRMASQGSVSRVKPVHADAEIAAKSGKSRLERAI